MRNLLTLTLFALLISCQHKPSISEDYVQEIEAWKKQRLRSLKAEDGYINLAGLFWLIDGDNSFGAAANNRLQFPADKSDNFLGVFTLTNDSVFLTPGIDAQIFNNDQLLQNQELAYHDSLKVIPEFTHESLRWTVIRRGDQFGVRLRDLEHPGLTSMNKIEYYPVDPDYRVEATFEPYDPPKMLKTSNVLGMIYDAEVPGVLSFELKGQKYRVEPNLDGDLHLRFTDETTGDETYGLGRYLHVDLPGGKSTVTVDFNKSYNPPCAFTEFATCPIPPKHNRLTLKVEAGEKTFGSH